MYPSRNGTNPQASAKILGKVATILFKHVVVTASVFKGEDAENLIDFPL